MLEKRLMKCFDAYLYDIETGACIGVQENLTNSSLAGTATETAIKNGQNNSEWASISSSKELTLELQSNVLDFNMIATQMGTKIAKDGVIFNTLSEVSTIDVSKKITLPETPLDDKRVEIVNLKTDEIIKSTEYKIAAKEVTFTTITGDVKVLPYEYSTVGVNEIVISADKFASAVGILLKTVAVDSNQRVTDNVEIKINKAKPSADFTVGSQSELTGNDNTTTFKCLEDAKKNLAVMRFLPIK